MAREPKSSTPGAQTQATTPNPATPPATTASGKTTVPETSTPTKTPEQSTPAANPSAGGMALLTEEQVKSFESVGYTRQEMAQWTSDEVRLQLEDLLATMPPSKPKETSSPPPTTPPTGQASPAIITDSRALDELKLEVERLLRRDAERDEKMARFMAQMEEQASSRSLSDASSGTSSELVTKVQNLRAGPVEIPGLTVLLPDGKRGSALAPGINLVLQEEWLKARDNPTVVLLLQQGFMPNASTGLRDLGTGQGLAKMDNLSSYQVIEASVDLEQVNQWLATETRPPIRMALQERKRQLQKASQEFEDRMAAARDSGAVHGR